MSTVGYEYRRGWERALRVLVATFVFVVLPLGGLVVVGCYRQLGSEVMVHQAGLAGMEKELMHQLEKRKKETDIALARVAGRISEPPALQPLDDRVTKGEKDAKDLSTQYSQLRKDFASLAKEVREKEPTGQAKIELEKLKKDLQEVEKKLKDKVDANTLGELKKQWAQEKAQLVTQATQAEKERDLARSEATARQTELQKVREELKQAPRVEEGNVLLLALHTSSLSLHGLGYKRLIRELAEQVKQDYHPHYKVGVCLREGGDPPETLIPLQEAWPKDAAGRFNRILKARDGTVDDGLAGCDVKVKEEFAATKGKRVCVVVASASCRPVPKEEFDKWQGVVVHAILIGSDKKSRAMELEHYLAWQAFCRSTAGTVTLLNARAKADDLDSETDLHKQLSTFLRKILQPELTRRPKS